MTLCYQKVLAFCSYSILYFAAKYNSTIMIIAPTVPPLANHTIGFNHQGVTASVIKPAACSLFSAVDIDPAFAAHETSPINSGMEHANTINVSISFGPILITHSPNIRLYLYILCIFVHNYCLVVYLSINTFIYLYILT